MNLKNLVPVFLLAFCFGCQTAPKNESIAQPAAEKLTLSAGDTVKITFTGAPELNTVQQIRRDGKVNIPMLGELAAAGLSPVEMEQELLKTYGSQLVNKQVTVVLESGLFPIFVSGAVLRPGKITADRPITALEAIMEAGGFDYARANAKAVRVIRNKDGQVQKFTLNLQKILNGEDQAPFYMKASDIIYVPEKFSWF